MSTNTGQGRKRGRPKGARNIGTIIREVARERITMREGDIAQSVTIAEALLLKARQLAMTGDIRLDKELDKLRQQLDPPTAEASAYLIAPEQMNAEEWIRRAEIANRFSKPPEEALSPTIHARPSPGPVDQPIQQTSPERSVRELQASPAVQPRLIR